MLNRTKLTYEELKTIIKKQTLEIEKMGRGNQALEDRIQELIHEGRRRKATDRRRRTVERKLRNENTAIKKASFIDSRTGLQNRLCLDQYFVTHAQRKSKNRAVALFLDIDDFKKINDTYGHDCGDHVLKTYGRIILNTLTSNAIAYRYGGDEVVIIISSEERRLKPQFNTDAQTLAEQIRNRMEEAEFDYVGRSLPCITISIGGARGVLGDIQEMVKKADEAMYRSKNAGRNMVIFDI